jgi:hypothetical protein
VIGKRQRTGYTGQVVSGINTKVMGNMAFDDRLNQLCALLWLLSGVGSLVMPRALARLGELELPGVRGLAEVRVNFGGLFIGGGLAALLINQPAAYQTLGIAMLGAAATRALALGLDKPALNRSYMALLLFETLLALGLLL